MAPPSRPNHDRNLALERASQVRGLLLLALAVLAFVFWRAGGLHRVFTPGWWRLW